MQFEKKQNDKNHESHSNQAVIFMIMISSVYNCVFFLAMSNFR